MYSSSTNTWIKSRSLQRLFILLSTTGLSRQLSTHTISTTASKNNKIAWFRNHALRLNDNESLLAAIKECSSPSTIIPIYLWEKKQSDDQTGGTASVLFTAHALKSLSLQLEGKLGMGSIATTNQNLQSSSGNANHIVDEVASRLAKEIVAICEKNDSSEIFYIRSNNLLLEDKLSEFLVANGITPRSFGGCSLLDYTKENVPWKDIILAHSWRSPLIPFVDFVLEKLSQDNQQEAVEIPLAKLQSLMGSVDSECFTDHVDIDKLLETLGNSGGSVWGDTIMESFPQTNEYAAMAELRYFLRTLKPKIDEEKQTHFTSRLSPFLARGLLSPRQVYHELLKQGDDSDTASFVRRLCWRDYTHAVVSLFPDVLYGHPIRLGYEVNTNELDNEQSHSLRMWKKGLTGFPLVDSGMRQLEKEGYMPQKVRLACSTCLVEGLNIPYQYGMRHFEEFLIDYDESINYNMWMNAGCVGLDPYYCGMKYRKRAYWDADGTYVKKWCPELKNVPDYVFLDQGRGMKKKIDCLYEPWTAPEHVLESAGVQLGKTYPFRVCDDRLNRQKFFERMRKTRVEWPIEYIDDCKRDIVALGRHKEAERIGLFTPRALQVKKATRINT